MEAEEKTLATKQAPEPIKQITLRVPQSMHEQLKAAAKRKGISMNEEIIFCLGQTATE